MSTLRASSELGREDWNPEAERLKQAIMHLLVISTIAGVIEWPAFGCSGLMSETGLLGSCFEGQCGVTAGFLAFPVIWLVMIGAGTAPRLKWWKSRT